MSGEPQRYQVLRHLATGGMAEIWLARQRGLEGFEKLVVLKRILPHLLANKEFIQMFVDEGRLAAQLSHPNIVQIFDLGKMNASLFIAMEFVQGENLRYVQKRIGERGHAGMPVAYAAKVLSQACEALYYAHNKADTRGKPLGLVHRDLSPANILVSYQGQVKIVDFGIAKAASHIRETRVGMVKGHYGYMSPEQCSSQPLDHRSDIFSLGIVLWELLTGRRLYSHNSDLATVKAICETAPAKPSTIRGNIPAELEAIVMRAISKRPDDRFKDCHRMHMALERFLHGQGSPITPVHLARFMKSLFPDRLQAWLKVIQSGGEGEFDSDTVDSLSYVFNMGTPSAAGDPAEGEQASVESPPDQAEATRQVQVSPELLNAMNTRKPVATAGVGRVPAGAGIHVEILIGDRVIRTVDLPDEAVVGSGARAHLRATGDAQVAEKHAVLHRDGDTIMLTTTGGPVDVNGERVDFAVLGPQDRVCAGHFTFRVIAGKSSAATPPSPGADSTQVVTRPPEIAEDTLGSAHLPLAEDMATDPGNPSGAARQASTRAERVPDAAPPDDTHAREKKAKARAAQEEARRVAKEKKAAAAKVAREEKARKAAEKAKARKAAGRDRPRSRIFPEPPPRPATALDLRDLPPDGTKLDIFADDPQDEDLLTGQPSAFPVETIIGGNEVAGLTLDDGRADPHGTPVAEILHTLEEVVLGAAILTPGKKYRVPSERKPLAKMKASGCRVNVPAGIEALHYRGELGQGDPLTGPTSVDLAPLDRLELRLDDGLYRVRVFRPAAAPEAQKNAFATKLWATCAGLAAAAHFLGFFSLVMVQTLDLFYLPVANTEMIEQFAEGKLDEADKPKKKKKKRKKKRKLARKKTPKKDPTEAKAKIPKRLRQRLQKRLNRAPGGGGAKSIINALKSPVRGEGTTLKEVVSNIDAIKGGGSRSAFRVAGTLSGLPGGKVNLARGGSTVVGTLGGTEVAGRGVGKLKGRGRGKVRGTVSSVRALAKVSGQLSREEVLKVINSKMGAIQGCYERALTRTPTLSGKITFEWKVRKTGKVGMAREKSSTMGNPKVSQCILKVIRGMKFPRPRGGEVIIAYPFMFRSVSS